MNTEKMYEYAKLILEVGINIREGEIVVVNSFPEAGEFTSMLVEEAYKLGAKYVLVDFVNSNVERKRLENSREEYLDYYPKAVADSRLKLLEEGASFIRIAGDDPDALKGVNASLISRSNIARMKASKEVSEKMSKNENKWCVVAFPSKKWAKKIFSDLPEETAVEKLFEVIMNIMKINDEDGAVKSWEEFKRKINERLEFLNGKQYDHLLYSSDKTELTVGLPKDHVWCGGGTVSKDGVEYMPNMPTEEVFTLPEKSKVNGYVSSTMPLIYSGNEISDFKLYLEDGKIVKVEAEKGQDLLQQLIDTDEGSHYFGEVALVSYDSPISNSGILFYNTLFDENASCHFALGRAYKTNLKGGENMSEEEFTNAGGNISLVHVDFMIGSNKMNICGVTSEGNKEEILRNGEWVI